MDTENLFFKDLFKKFLGFFVQNHHNIVHRSSCSLFENPGYSFLIFHFKFFASVIISFTKMCFVSNRWSTFIS